MVKRILANAVRERRWAMRAARVARSMVTSFKPLAPELGDLIRRCNLVHEAWYRLANPDLSLKAGSAVDHYISQGFREDRSPHPLFDPRYYLGQYPDVAKSGVPAIVHYLKHGGPEWRSPHPLFEIAKYRQRYRDRFDPAETPGAFVDFCASDDRLEAFRFFDADYYRGNAPSLDGPPNRLLEHFLSEGVLAGRDPHPLIWLDRLRPDATGPERAEAFRHLFLPPVSGLVASPHPAFDCDFYLQRNEEITCHPVIHYLRNWKTADLWPNPIFSTRYYLTQIDPALVRPDPLSHYLAEGEALGLRPNFYFDAAYCRAAWGKALAPGEHPLVHYLAHGWQPSLSPSERFCQRYYVSRVPEVARDRIPALANFLQRQPLIWAVPAAPTAFLDVTGGMPAEDVASQIRDMARAAAGATDPRVSVIVPVYKNLDYTLRCLHSIFLSADATPFEVIVADDASPDGSGAFLAESLADVPRIRVVRNETNLGFLRSCNAAADMAAGDYLLFLNNDTAVIDGWLDELVATFEREADAGLVGSKLIYPNGLLQEAGGIVWSDGSAANYGREDDPMRPEYNYARDVDYVSGAAILVDGAAWKTVGGFSPDYAPAYYEDTDLAMKLRRIGKRVIYQPLSQVVHFEGISSGTDVSTGVKFYQTVNRKRFRDTWEQELATHGDTRDFSRACVDRRPKGRILVYDHGLPKPDRDSGSVTAFHMMSILCSLGYRVTFVPESLEWAGRYARALQRLGVEVLSRPYIDDARTYLLEHGGEFDMAILSRATHGGRILNEFKARHPHVPVVFDTVDLHHLRLQRQIDQAPTEELQVLAADMKKTELGAIRNADATLLVSEYEARYLLDEIGPFPHMVLPLIYSEAEKKSPFEAREDIAFVGGYRHPPNVDAVEYLVNEIWPLFREHGTGACLHIIGSDVPEAFADYAADDIRIVGFVADLEGYLDRVRVTVAPLRYGAGVKGKVGNSLRLGVPCVVTPVAAEGMGLVDGETIMIGRTPEAFAAALRTLYTDADVWNRLSDEGQRYASRAFGIGAARAKLAALCSALIGGPGAGARSLSNSIGASSPKAKANMGAGE